MTTRVLRISIVLALAAWCGRTKSAETILLDEFDSFELGELWQEADAGAPDVALAVIGGVLQMVSSGSADEFLGIQTIAPIPLDRLTNLTVETRLQPVNAGVEGTVAAAEVALLGSSGEIIRAFASNNAGPDPESANDWADHYLDSMNNVATSGPWPHCGSPACDAPRNFILTVDGNGTTLRSFDDDEETDENGMPVPTFEASFDNFTFSDLGAEVTIALRQLAVMNGDDAIGNFDQIIVTTEIVEFVSGDFDGDGVYSSMDADLLVAEIAANTNNEAFDLTGDVTVDDADLQAWLVEAGTALGFADSLLPGDANLDGTVNATDLNALGLNWQESVAAWSAGDFNADGLVNAGDLNVLGLSWQSSAPMAAASSVPEPTSCLLLILGGLAACRFGRFSS